MWLRRPRLHGPPTPCWTFTPSPPPPPSQGGLLMKICPVFGVGWDICIYDPKSLFSGRLSRHHQVGLPPPCQSLGTSKKIITPPTLLFTSNHCLGTSASPPSPLSHGILGILPISTEKPTRGVQITRFKVWMNGFKP